MKQQPLQFSYLKGKLIGIVLLFSTIMCGQTIQVLDESGNSLPGVEVFNEALTIGNITDENGKIDLTSANPKEILHFRYLGYEEVVTTFQAILNAGNMVTMIEIDQIMEEVVVLGRKSVAQSEIPFQIETVTRKEIAATNAQTSADALSQHAGVFVQKSQMGGGSPVIRGFEANRVLLVVDGVRLNNAIFRGGHLQNAITVDQAMLDRMEVVFGPNSLMYGSDALGGVVNFKTRDPRLSSNASSVIETNYYARYATANNEKSIHGDISFGKEKWGSLTSITYSNYGDLRTGKNRDNRFPDFGKRPFIQILNDDGTDSIIANEDPNLQVGTSYNQFDVLQKFLFVPSETQRFKANFQYSTSTDVPRYDNLNEYRDGALRWGEWYYGPQNRLLASLDYRHLAETKFYDQFIAIASFQKIDEDRISRRFNNPNRTSQEEDVNVFSITLDASKNLYNNSVRLEYGVDLQHNDVTSTAFTQDIISTAITTDLTRYASDLNQLTNTGAYLYLKGQNKKETIHYSGGLRYARSNYKLRYDLNDPIEWPNEFYDGIQGNNSAITWSVGGTWEVLPTFQLRSMFSTAFRSPNIDDLAKIRVNADEITFPNLNLKPERSTNFELTMAYKKSRDLQLSATGFYTSLSDAIIRKDFTTPDGATTVITQGDTLNVVGNVNAQRGRIYGISLNASGKMNARFGWYASYNLTKGKELLDGNETAPLTHIPPAYGKLGIDYDYKKFGWKAVWRYNASKPLEEFGGSADNPDLATPIGALAWSTFNLYGNWNFSKQLQLSLSLENILDKHYRQFASGVSAPGRNLIISIRGNF